MMARLCVDRIFAEYSASGLKRAQDLARQAPPDLPDPEELEKMEEIERERLEAMLEAITLAGSAD